MYFTIGIAPKTKKNSQQIVKGKNGNMFNDFDQRTYDYDALEKKILANK